MPPGGRQPRASNLVRRGDDLHLEEDHKKKGSAERLLHNFTRPAFVDDVRHADHGSVWILRTASIQFFLGEVGSGAQPHWHQTAWNWLVHGRKEWWLWPPRDATYALSHTKQVLNALDSPVKGGVSGVGGGEDRAGAVLWCEQRPGDVLVVPAAWGHATLNTQPSIGWASEVDHDRGYHDGDDAAFGDQWWRVSNVEGVPEPPSEENLGDDEILYGDI